MACLSGVFLFGPPASAQSLTFRGSLSPFPCTAVDAAGSLAYIAGNNHFAVIDVTSPTPVLRGQVTPGAAQIHAVSAAGSYAYCAGDASGLVIISVADPVHPAWTAALTIGSPANGVAANDTLVAVSSVAGVSLVGTRSALHPHLLASYACAGRWVEFDPSGTRLHVGTDDGVIRLDITRHIAGGDTTFTLERSTQYGSSRLSPVAVASPYVDAVNAASLTAIRADNYTFAGQYSAPAAIRAVAGGSACSFIALASGALQYLDQRQATPQFVVGATISGTPSGVALGQAASQPLVIVSHSSGMSVFAYDALDAGDPTAPPLADRFTLRAFPNPFNSSVTLSIEVSAPDDCELTVFNLLGRAVFTDQFRASGTVTRTLDFAAQPGGTYFARVSGRTACVVQKLVYVP